MRKTFEALNDTWLRAIGVPLFALIANLVFYTDEWISGHFSFWYCYSTALIATLLFWYLNRWVLVFFREKFPTLRETGKRMLYQFLVSTLTSTALSFMLTAFYDRLNFWGKDLLWPDYLYNVLVVLIFIYTAAGLYEILFYFSMWQQSVKEAEQLKKANLQSQLESLKNQVSPHFLFNSLNTLSSLIEEDQSKAIQFVNELSRVYRYLLQSNEKQLIAVQEELNFLQAYFFLLKTRFGDGISLDIKISDEVAQKLIPPLTMQMLIENAVKHNVVSGTKPLKIEIISEGSQLCVTNNFQKKTIHVLSNGLGLANVSAKYRLLNQGAIRVFQDESIFQVCLPLIAVNHENAAH